VVAAAAVVTVAVVRAATLPDRRLGKDLRAYCHDATKEDQVPKGA